MKNPDNEDIIILVCILLIAAGFQQYRGNRFGRLWVRPWIAKQFVNKLCMKHAT
jgi:hypothetical protein